jgi:haloacid dehalogenase superfamily, subfamily IA, variant 3 with third motif having DD or ED
MTHQPPPRRFRALIFDFDGTLCDTETPEYEVWQSLFAEHGAELPLTVWAAGIGIGPAESPFDPHAYLESCLGRACDRAALHAVTRARFEERLHATEPRPGIVACLDEARALGLRLAVASSSSRAWVEGHLARLGLADRFELTRTSDDVARTKPDPELYLSACAALGVAPAEAVAFEDSPNGIRAAKAAGLACVAFPNPLTALLPLPEPDYLATSLEEVTLAELLGLLQESR